MNTTRPYTFDRVVRIVIGLTVLVILFLLVKRLSDVLLPFLIAWLIAYLLQPIVSFFQYKLKFKSRILSIACTLLLFAGLLTGLIFVLTPLVSNEVQKLAEIISLYTQGITVDTIIPVAWQNEIRAYLSQLDIQSVLKDENLMLVIKKVAPQLWSLLNGSINVVLGLMAAVIVFLYLIFILIDYEKITSGVFEIIPGKYRTLITEIIHDLEAGMNRYFRGQALVALIVTVLFAIGFSIGGLPLSIVLALFLGVLNMVPYLKTIAIIPGLFLAFLQSAETGQSFLSIMIWLVAVFVVIQIIEDVLLVPNIMNKATGLNPAVILLSLSIWGSLMGMVGLIIALPLTTVIISYYKRFVLNEEKPDDSQDKNEETIPNAEEVEI
ncbi:MAG: AI-2E family transporter [Bacteroidales bacterium]|nr:AI-2E family transporter [Bacteroidales bacterium]